MKRLLRLPMALLGIAAISFPVEAANPNWVEGLFGGGKPPHPAVVRVYAPERNGASLGSGALVAVSQDHGLVMTNWHVVRDATGPIVVAFPDGFRSGAHAVENRPGLGLGRSGHLAPQRPTDTSFDRAAATGRTLDNCRLRQRQLPRGHRALHAVCLTRREQTL